MNVSLNPKGIFKINHSKIWMAIGFYCFKPKILNVGYQTKTGMIKKGIKLSHQLNQFCFDDKELNQYALSMDDWNELKILCEFLKIFTDCDKFMQKENYANSSHNIIPTNIILSEHLII